jgi:hypothetical protein
MRRGLWWVAGAFMLLLLGFSPEAWATDWMWGCWNCEYSGMTGNSQYCSMAGNGGTGVTLCKESSFSLTTFCFLGGQPCYNTEVSGGGGGGGGTGGGACHVGPSAPCPAQCMSCSRDLY